MKENKITTYLLYAVGEIILVVVGILIAVSIDDWNTVYNNRQKEIKYLKSIELDLKKDLEELAEQSGFRHEKKDGSERIIEYMNGVSYDDTEIIYYISNSIYERYFVPNNTTYTELSSSGNLNLLSNDSIKVLLLELQNLYQQNKGMIDHERFDYREYVSKELTKYVDLNSLEPIREQQKTAAEMNISIADFEPILNNVRFKNGMHIMEGMSGGFLEMYEIISDKSRKVIKHIEQELKEENP
ncbi:MAG: hypothetical protein HRT61_03325 [Ekhidna sp.]|nr:hypothetical protein [Ekhidna sp.]